MLKSDILQTDKHSIIIMDTTEKSSTLKSLKYYKNPTANI
jgi:hypothetical protein